MLFGVYVCLLHRTQKSIILTVGGNPKSPDFIISISAILSNSCGLCPLQATAPKLAKDEPLQWRRVLLLIRTDLWGVVSSWLPDAVQTRGEEFNLPWRMLRLLSFDSYIIASLQEKKCLFIVGGGGSKQTTPGQMHAALSWQPATLMPDSFDFRDAKLAGVRLYETLARVSSCTTAAWIFGDTLLDVIARHHRHAQKSCFWWKLCKHHTSAHHLSFPGLSEYQITSGAWIMDVI